MSVEGHPQPNLRDMTTFSSTSAGPSCTPIPRAQTFPSDPDGPRAPDRPGIDRPPTAHPGINRHAHPVPFRPAGSPRGDVFSAL